MSTQIVRRRGFTLIELVLSIVLLGIVLSVGTSVVSDSFITARNLNAQTASITDLRSALDRVARELRSVALVNVGSLREFDVQTAGPSSVSFNKVDAFGSLTRVTLALQSGELQLTLGAAGPPVVLLRDVTGFSLVYLNSANALLTANNQCGANPCPSSWRQAVRSVQITLTVSTTGAGAQSLTTLAALRSR